MRNPVLSTTVFARRVRRALPALIAALALAPDAQALRLVNYNLTNYPGTQSSVRNPRYRTILAPVSPDILVTQEMTGTGVTPPGLNDFLTNVLNTLEPGQWSVAPFYNGNDTDNALFYKQDKVAVISSRAFYPNPATNLRYVTVWQLRPANYTSSAADIWVYSTHLKASMGFETDRFNEAVGIRNDMDALPAGAHAILCGDFNMYTSSEPAYGRFTASMADNDGRLYDPMNPTLVTQAWNNNGTFASIHTQCPCLNNCPAGFGFAGGGLDDRFDLLLPTYPFKDGAGLEIIAGSYVPIGNDALHFNKDINAAPLIPEGQTYADALVGASDHLPVRVDIRLPARFLASPGVIAFGTVITGATAAQALSIANPATAPADNLDYSMTADAGFAAPGGAFSVAPGAPAGAHSISMNTATTGVKSGAVHVSSDAPDAPATDIAVSGTVLAHAVASLDGAATVLASLADFGDHQAVAFTDQPVSVYNLGWTALQAQLALGSATVSGGDGRFSITGGFSPVQVAGTAQTYSLHFDATNFIANADSVFTASLTFGSADEALPGGAVQPNLVVTLRAKVLAAPVDVAASLPVRTRLYTPMPNPPTSAGTTLRFDLVRGEDVNLAVFDVAGRRVASLASGPYPAGVHALRWMGRDANGTPLGSGVYFVRMSGRFATQTVRVTLLR